jgi:hypothetical protein
LSSALVRKMKASGTVSRKLEWQRTATERC